VDTIGPKGKAVKICHIVETLDIGGLEKIVVEIVLNLKGYEHHVWCLKYKGAMAERIEERDIPIKEFHFEGGLRPSLVYRLAKELRRGDFTMVSSHGLFTSIWARSAALLAGVPVSIVHCHGTYYGITAMTVIKLKFLACFTSRIIAVSEAVKKSLIEFVGISPKKITVVYNGVPDMRPQDFSLKARCREKLGLGIDDFVIGHIGRFVWWKGQHALINIAAMCRKEYPDFKWIFAGDGPERKKMELEIKKFGLNGTVTLLGLRDDIEDILHAMDLFVFPSFLKEGLPLVLIEASSAGLPLIATDTGGNSEVIKDGVNGFIVPPKDTERIIEKIRYLYKKPAERERMGLNARNIWDEKFRQERMLQKVRSVYEDEILKMRRCRFSKITARQDKRCPLRYYTCTRPRG